MHDRSAWHILAVLILFASAASAAPVSISFHPLSDGGTYTLDSVDAVEKTDGAFVLVEKTSAEQRNFVNIQADLSLENYASKDELIKATPLASPKSSEFVVVIEIRAAGNDASVWQSKTPKTALSFPSDFVKSERIDKELNAKTDAQLKQEVTKAYGQFYPLFHIPSVALRYDSTDVVRGGWLDAQADNAKIVAMAKPVIFDEAAFQSIAGSAPRFDSLEIRRSVNPGRLRRPTGTSPAFSWSGRTQLQYAPNGDYAVFMDAYPEVFRGESKGYQPTPKRFAAPELAAVAHHVKPQQTAQYLLDVSQIANAPVTLTFGQGYRIEIIDASQDGGIRFKLKDFWGHSFNVGGQNTFQGNDIVSQVALSNGKTSTLPSADRLAAGAKLGEKEAKEKIALQFMFSRPTREQIAAAYKDQVKNGDNPLDAPWLERIPKQYVVLTIRQTADLDLPEPPATTPKEATETPKEVQVSGPQEPEPASSLPGEGRLRSVSVKSSGDYSCSHHTHRLHRPGCPNHRHRRPAIQRPPNRGQQV
ncbi:hypothetical protein HY572_04440 [Candidatus Micrarchaeota archaeon]|nr:hypothetical protein [Candidatus Micrarchaeota archaeon]